MIRPKPGRLGWLAALALWIPSDEALATGAAASDAPRTSLGAWLSGEAATGSWSGRRSQLAERGLVPFAGWTGEVFRNLHGGLERGTGLEGLLEFGADAELEKAVGWRGASLHASALWIQSSDDPSADFVGNFDEVSNIAGDAAVRLYQLYLEQELDDGALRYKLGQLALDDDFMVSEGALLFLNASFGPLPVESANTAAPVYPLAALGGWARWAPLPGFSLQLGLYNGDAGRQDSNPGFDYAIGSASGAIGLAEIGIETSWLGRDASFKVGGYYHSGDFSDFDSGKAKSGNFAVYVVVDQLLLGTRHDERLAAFLRAGISPWVDRSVVDWYLDAGLTARGLRAGDRIGLGFSHAHFGSDFVSAQQRAGSRVRDSESIIELTYRLALTPWLALQPDLQYVIDPRDAGGRDAFVAGLRAALTF